MDKHIFIFIVSSHLTSNMFLFIHEMWLTYYGSIDSLSYAMLYKKETSNTCYTLRGMMSIIFNVQIK